MNAKRLSGLILAISLLTVSNVYAAKQGEDRKQDVIDIHAVRLSVKPGDNKAILIPRRLLVYRDAIPGVFVLEDNESRFRMVLPGKRVGSNIQILSGLFGNEVLLSDKYDDLHDGSHVKVIK